MDALSAMRRANQVYHEQLCERTVLGCGVAFISPGFGALPGVNQMREVVIPQGSTMAAACAEAQAYFASRGARCDRWVPAATQPAEPIEPHLVEQGFAPRTKTVMLLRNEPRLPEDRGIRVLPARAMRAALRQLILEDPYYSAHQRELAVEAEFERLDDARYNLFVAMVEGKPAGRAALLEAGEVAAVYSVVVAEPFRRRGIGGALMRHLLALCKRLAMRMTVLETVGDDPGVARLYGKSGFEPAAHYIEFLPASGQG